MVTVVEQEMRGGECYGEADWKKDQSDLIIVPRSTGII
jgi:hypothetical protein